MKKSIIIIVMVSLSITSCSLFKKKIMIEQAIAQKKKIDATANPALKRLITQELGKKRIVLNNILVKKISESTNIDYDFCIISDIEVEDMAIECYIYSKNISRISKLIENKSRINVVGNFGRFFSMLDEYYTKLEIHEAKVTLKDKKKKKAKK